MTYQHALLIIASITLLYLAVVGLSFASKKTAPRQIKSGSSVLLTRAGLTLYLIYSVIYFLIWLNGGVATDYVARGITIPEGAYELFTDPFGYPILGFDFIRMNYIAVIVIRVLWLAFLIFLYILSLKYIKRHRKREMNYAYLTVMRIVLAVFLAYAIYDYMLGDLFALFGAVSLVLTLIGIRVQMKVYLLKFRSEDIDTFRALKRYCKNRGLTMSQPQIKAYNVRKGPSTLYGGQVKKQQIFYAIGQAANKKFMQIAAFVASAYKARFAVKGNVAVFLKEQNPSTSRVFEDIIDEIDADEAEVIAAGEGCLVGKPKLKARLRPSYILASFRCFHRLEPNKKAGRILSVCALPILIFGTVIFMMGFIKNPLLPFAVFGIFGWEKATWFIDAKFWYGLLINVGGGILSAAGYWIYGSGSDLEGFDKFVYIACIVLFCIAFSVVVATVVITAVIIVLVVMAAIFALSFFSNNGIPTRQTNNNVQSNDALKEYLGNGSMVLDGAHYYIQKSDGTRIGGIESYDSATGIGKGYDGTTYIVQNGGLRHK